MIMKRYLANKDGSSKMVHDRKYVKGDCNINLITDADEFDSFQKINRKKFPNNCKKCMNR